MPIKFTTHEKYIAPKAKKRTHDFALCGESCSSLAHNDKNQREKERKKKSDILNLSENGSLPFPQMTLLWLVAVSLHSEYLIQ